MNLTIYLEIFGGTSLSNDKDSVISLTGAKKYFGAVHALEDGQIDLFAGEAHALVGENGAGKSTLVKIFAGLHRPDSGSLKFDGNEVFFNSPRDAIEAGVAVIYQEPTLFPDLTVAENIFMERQPQRSFRRIDYRSMNKAARVIFSRLEVDLDPTRLALGLSIAEQQIVEIAKALSLEARVIIMDEPTAALSSVEVHRLFRVAETLKNSGVAILFISHRLDEVFTLCERVTVMRDGRFVLTTMSSETNEDALVRAMVGRDVERRSDQIRGIDLKPLLEVEHLTLEGLFADISFTVAAGEVVALSGLVGAGRSEVATAIFGVRRYDYGSVKVGGKALKRGSPSSAMAAGIGLVPEDRRLQGLVMEQSIARNIAMGSFKSLKRKGLIRSLTETRFAADWSVKLQIKYGNLGNSVSTLSGGNQQKVVLAKWMSRSPKVLIVDEPTRGIDIGTKAEVHRLILELAKSGVAVLVISSELPEVLNLADRILVMREGRLVAEFDHKGATEEAIIAAATLSKEVKAA